MAKSRYDVSSLYDSNRRRKEEEGERSIQNQMRSNSNNNSSKMTKSEWQDKYSAAKKKNYEDNERNIQNQMRSNSYHDRELVRRDLDEENIQRQMRSNSYHDREIVRTDRDEANIRKQMRTNRANTTDNPDYQKYDMRRREGQRKARAIANTLKSVGDSIGRKGGAMDREWKNHKWISRERNDAGKWIYDYGDSGSSKRGSSKPVLKTRVAKKGVDSENLPKRKNDFERAIDNAGKTLNDIGSNAGKTLNDIGSNAAKLASEVGDSVNKTISDITTNAAVIRDLGKVFIDNMFR